VPPAPSSDQLTDQLDLIINRAADRNARIAELADPSAIKGADNLGALKDTFGWEFTWRVDDPVITGDSMNARLAVTLNDHSGRPSITKTWPMAYSDVGDRWKLSKASICMMTQYFQSSC
jgi:hypothetical protein